MGEYYLPDLCLYATCPLKVKYKQQGVPAIVSCADDRYIISTALRDTYIKYFQMKGLGKPITISRAAAMFSKLAFSYKKQYAQSNSIFFNDTQLLIDAHALVVGIEKFLNPTDELIAANFPLERVIGGHLIRDESDLIVFRHPPNKESYVDIIYFDTNAEIKVPDFNLLLRVNFGLSVVTRELMGEALKIKSTLYNILSGNLREIVLSREQRFNYQRLIKNIINGVEAGAFYPRPSFGACEHCSYKTICSWKLNDKNKIITTN